MTTVAFATIGLLNLGLLGGTRCALPNEKAQTLESLSGLIEFVITYQRCPDGERELINGHFIHHAQKNWRGQALFYNCNASRGGVAADVRSAGPDRIFGTADDVVSEDIVPTPVAATE
jgi:hypothetical protein